MKDILVVDDDRIVLELVKRVLGREGFVAHCAESGEEALEQIKERTFSLMITDYNMPGLNGLELARKGLELGTSHAHNHGHRRNFTESRPSG